MPESPASWALLAAVLVFVLFVLIKSRLPVGAGGAEGRERLAEAKRRVRDAKGDPHERAAALRQAAEVALEDLGRPNLAASFARRAERVDPGDPDSVRAVAAALRRAERYRALEKLLWRRLAGGLRGEVRERAFEELLSLYDGPLRRPDQAKVLRRLLRDAGMGGGGGKGERT